MKVSKIERFFFGLTRIIAVLGALVGILAIGLLVLNLLKPDQQVENIALSDVNTEHVTEKNSTLIAKSNINLDMHQNIKDYLFEGTTGDEGDKNATIVLGWLESIPEKYRQNFLDNMSSIIKDANLKKVDLNIAVNNYRTLKIEAINEIERNEYKNLAKKGVTYAALIGVIFFIVLMSMMLVLLSIERNSQKNTN